MLDTTTLCRTLAYAFPTLIHSGTLRLLCRAVRDEIDSGRFYAQHCGVDVSARRHIDVMPVNP
jgi:hypothetical protein